MQIFFGRRTERVPFSPSVSVGSRVRLTNDMLLDHNSTDTKECTAFEVQYHVRGRRKRQPLTGRCQTVQDLINLANSLFPHSPIAIRGSALTPNTERCSSALIRNGKHCNARAALVCKEMFPLSRSQFNNDRQDLSLRACFSHNSRGCGAGFFFTFWRHGQCLPSGPESDQEGWC